MAFEHEQFQRFLQNDNTLPPSPSPTPPRGGERREGRKTSSPSQQMRRSSSPAQRRQPGKKVSWSRSGRAGPRRRCEPLSPQGRVAMWIVCAKLALFCAWLIHELASGFDESQCLLAATNNNLIPAEENQREPTAQTILNSQMQTRQTVEPVRAEKEREQPQLPSIPNSHAVQPNESQQQPQTQIVPKRRRKVILRRRLLRKGATGAATSNSEANASQKGGAIRRVVWRVVPLKKLPANGDSGEDIGEQFMQIQEVQPMRTKTGTTIMLTTKDGRQRQLRRIARRRTTSGGKKTQLADPNANGLDLSMIRESAWKSEGRMVQQREGNEESPNRPKLAIYAALSVPDQLNTLLGQVLCYVRTVLDCWCLLQCFCCALFMLGLHLRHRLLAMVPVVVDVVSIVLALIFGISTLMFPLILLLLQANLPSRPLLLCFGLSTAIHLAIAAFAWTTFLQLKAINSKGEEEQQMPRKSIV